ncbi:unnamed protein product, partial [Iphiclides podalirius]
MTHAPALFTKLLMMPLTRIPPKPDSSEERPHFDDDFCPSSERAARPSPITFSLRYLHLLRHSTRPCRMMWFELIGNESYRQDTTDLVVDVEAPTPHVIHAFGRATLVATESMPYVGHAKCVSRTPTRDFASAKVHGDTDLFRPAARYLFAFISAARLGVGSGFSANMIRARACLRRAVQRSQCRHNKEDEGTEEPSFIFLKRSGRRGSTALSTTWQRLLDDGQAPIITTNHA